VWPSPDGESVENGTEEAELHIEITGMGYRVLIANVKRCNL